MDGAFFVSNAVLSEHLAATRQLIDSLERARHPTLATLFGIIQEYGPKMSISACRHAASSRSNVR